MVFGSEPSTRAGSLALGTIQLTGTSVGFGMGIHEDDTEYAVALQIELTDRAYLTLSAVNFDTAEVTYGVAFTLELDK
jgi:hypothetical protein